MDKDIKEIISEAYTMNSEYRDNAGFEEWKKKEVDRFIRATRKNDIDDVLDLGAGSGMFGKLFQDEGFKVKCIDLSAGMVELCKKRKLDAEQMDFYNMTFEDRSRGGIWSMNTLLHVPKRSLKVVLKEISRIMKDDGIAYIGFYGGQDFEGIWKEDFYEPKRFFSFFLDEDIRRIMELHFDVVEFSSLDIGRDNFNYQSFILKKKMADDDATPDNIKQPRAATEKRARVDVATSSHLSPSDHSAH